MNRFLDDKAAHFDQLPTGLGAGLVPKANRLLGCVDRRPYILTTPLGAKPPDLVEQFDYTARVDFAQEMQPSSREWYTPLWDQPTQGCVQPPDRRTASHLRWRLAVECRRIIVVGVPAPEEWNL